MPPGMAAFFQGENDVVFLYIGWVAAVVQRPL